MPKYKETDNFIVDLRDSKQSTPDHSAGQAVDNIQYPISNMGHFIKYNNGFLIFVVIGIIAFSSFAFASEDVRGSTIGTQQILAEGVDNTLLLEADFDNFSMDFKITGIIENDEQFLISYSFTDLVLSDNVWQYAENTATRRISKPFRQDLGVYLAGQLSQESSSRIKTLKKEQKTAQNEGKTQVVQVTKYSGLIGLVLDSTAKAFPGYEPVKKQALPTPEVDARAFSRSQNSAPDSLTQVYESWVDNNPEQVVNLESGVVIEDNATNSSSTEVVVEPVVEEIVEEIIEPVVEVVSEVVEEVVPVEEVTEPGVEEVIEPVVESDE